MDTDQKLSDIHDKINGVAREVSEIKGIIETSLPNLATKDAVAAAIAEHDSGCRRAMALRHPPNRRKQAAIGGGLLAVVSGIVYAVAEIIPYFQ